jgi:hypothetical protein
MRTKGGTKVAAFSLLVSLQKLNIFVNSFMIENQFYNHTNLQT